MDSEDDTTDSYHTNFDTHGFCDICDIAENLVAPDGCEPCHGECEGKRRALYFDILMGYQQAEHKSLGDLKHEPWCSKNRNTRHSGDGIVRPCEFHYKRFLPYKLPPVRKWNDAILGTLPTCLECGNVVKWTERQAAYLFRQHLLQGREFQDNDAGVAELHRLAALDAVAEREAVQIVGECDRQIALAQQKRALYLPRLAGDPSISTTQLAELLQPHTVAEVQALAS